MCTSYCSNPYQADTPIKRTPLLSGHLDEVPKVSDYIIDRFILMLFNFKIAFVQLLQGIFQSTMKNVNILHCFPFIVNWRQSFPSNTVLLGLWKRDWNLTHALFTPGYQVFLLPAMDYPKVSHFAAGGQRNAGSGGEIAIHQEISSLNDKNCKPFLWPKN